METFVAWAIWDSFELSILFCFFWEWTWIGFWSMDNSKNRQQNDHLGVNKTSKNIRKGQLQQPNVGNNAHRQQPQPQVYNISKNDFRNIVQQLTGSSSQEPLPRLPQNPPKPKSMPLQKIRSPILTPINQSHIPPSLLTPAGASPTFPSNNDFVGPSHFGYTASTMTASGDSTWANTATSNLSLHAIFSEFNHGSSQIRGRT